MKFKPTEEQSTLINTGYLPGSLVSVKAYAGTGKTTTLVEVSKKLPGPILYLVYNKAAQVDAKKRFPDSVEVRTVHSLCWAGFGSNYKEKLGNLTAASCLDVLNRDGVLRDREEIWMLSTVACRTVRDFTFSDSPAITMDHVPHKWGLHFLAPQQRDQVHSLAIRTWEAMQNVHDMKVPMTFDGYLKLYELSGKRPNYNVIMLDEAQDSNPVTLSLLRNAAKGNTMAIMIGDPHQQIYAFRGSRNAFDKVKHDKEYRLTESFRFDQTIADIASNILSKYKNEPIPLIGLKVHDPDTPAKTTAVLCRTNAQVIEQALALARKGKTYRIAGGPPTHIFNDCFDILNLDRPKRTRGPISNPLIAMFESSSELVEYAQTSGDRCLESQVKFARQHASDLVDMKNTVEEFHSTKSKHILTTAHKAKGLEWDDVTLAQDFLLSFSQENVLPKDEANLLYVACTRAKQKLHIPIEVREMIEEGKPEEANP